MENNLPVNLEVKADLTETVNNAYNDLVAPPAKQAGKGLAFCLQFLGSLVRPYMYEKIAEAEYKIKDIDRQLALKHSMVPDENKTLPRTCILGPALDVLKYNLDEDQIKEMFINIISNELDDRKQSKVLPSYISIVSQLSKQDALFLKLFKDKNVDLFCCIQINIHNNENRAYYPYGTYLSTHYEKTNDVSSLSSRKLNNLVIDNLLRLKLINLDYKIIPDGREEEYNCLFSNYTNNVDLGAFNHFEYEKGCISLTEYGKNFIDICLS